MNKLFATAGAIAFAALVSISVTTPSSAHMDPVGAGIVGGMLGFVAGAAVASSNDDGGPVYVDEGYGWHRHVHACFRAYGDAYDPSTDTYEADDGYDYRCRL